MTEKRVNRSLRLQKILGRMAVFLTAPLTVLFMKLAGYRIRNLREVRRTVAELIRRHNGPWLICANHLTLIDSIILVYAMFPAYRYMFRFGLLPWNMPEYMNFNRNKLVGLYCYLVKCIPVIRGGDRDAVKMTLDKCVHILNAGENLMIFPEGTRSRHGRVNTEDFSYNVGRWFYKIPDVHVMCIYLRGEGQDTYSDFPGRGEKFTMLVEECHPRTDSTGLRAHRDCAWQIVDQLAEMEQNYFDVRGQ